MKNDMDLQHQKGQSDQVQALKTTSTSNKHTRPMLHGLPKTSQLFEYARSHKRSACNPGAHAEPSLTVALISKNKIHTTPFPSVPYLRNAPQKNAHAPSCIDLLYISCAVTNRQPEPGFYCRFSRREGPKSASTGAFRSFLSFTEYSDMSRRWSLGK